MNINWDRVGRIGLTTLIIIGLFFGGILLVAFCCLLFFAMFYNVWTMLAASIVLLLALTVNWASRIADRANAKNKTPWRYIRSKM